MVEEVLSVTGMHCPKCTERVEKTVGAIAGVESVSADHEEDRVVVVYDGDAATLDAVKAAIIEEDFALA